VELKMFPEETHVKIVKQLDDIESEVFRLYRKTERLRLELQRKWRVLPSGQRWSEEAQQKSEAGEI
jgi:hypothetical protein